jgi:hypothetical protein
VTPPRPRKRYRCRYCQAELPAWLPVFQAPDGAMLLHHLAQDHPDRVKYYLDRMPTDDNHERVVVEAYEVGFPGGTAKFCTLGHYERYR